MKRFVAILMLMMLSYSSYGISKTLPVTLSALGGLQEEGFFACSPHSFAHSRVRVLNRRTGWSIVVALLDHCRGSDAAELLLSPEAAYAIGVDSDESTMVRVEEIY